MILTHYTLRQPKILFALKHQPTNKKKYLFIFTKKVLPKLRMCGHPKYPKAKISSFHP